MRTHHPKHPAISTTTGGAIVIVIIIIIAVGVYFAETSSTSKTATTTSSSSSSLTSTSSSTSSSSVSSSTSLSTSSSNQTSSSSASTNSSSSVTITIPQGAGGPQELNFSPSTTTVAPGTTITFSDQDNSAMHNIYFTSIPSGATISQNPSPNLNQGDTYQVTLTVPGTYHFECQYHPGWMQGTIVVS